MPKQPQAEVNASSRQRDNESGSDSESSDELIEAELIAYQEFFRILQERKNNIQPNE